MKCRNKKNLLCFITLLIVVIVGCFVYFNAKYVSYEYIEHLNELKKGKIIIKIDNEIITDSDINDARLMPNNFSDKDILNKLIEDDILFLMAQENRLKVSKKNLNNLVYQSKTFLEQSSKEDKDKLNTIVKALNLTPEEYWNTYAPPAYAKAMIIGKMKTKIKDDISREIIKKHPKWTEIEIKNEYLEKYQEKINEFKKQHIVESFLP